MNAGDNTSEDRDSSPKPTTPEATAAALPPPLPTAKSSTSQDSAAKQATTALPPPPLPSSGGSASPKPTPFQIPWHKIPDFGLGHAAKWVIPTTIVGAMAAGLLGLILLIWISMPNLAPKTFPVEEYRKQVVTRMNNELMAKDNQVRKRIEDAHVTVTAKSAKVSSCTIRTIDGSQDAGENGRNVSEVDVVITVVWDGVFQKDGYTELEIVYDSQNQTVKETKFLKSSAMLNLEQVNWLKVGAEVAAILITINSGSD